ncbi:MAG: hypothetical protein WA943_13465 [Parvibaculum sp.]|uniref:hypothetical protein n=1 Tax=Parvibaculum sp. TaxID=2024848 RepID=UPI003C7432A6
MKLTTMSRHVAAAVILLGLAILPGCANEPPPAPQAAIGFTGKPIKLDVASIAVDERYNPPGRAPNVEQLHAVTPTTVAQRWADTRLVAVGTRGIATLTIFNASVVESKLPVKGGLTGFFGDQTDTKITATLRAELVVSRPGDQAGAFATYKAIVNASGEKTILQSANLNDRDRAYFELMQLIAQKFDAALSAEVSRTMAPVIR